MLVTVKLMDMLTSQGLRSYVIRIRSILFRSHYFVSYIYTQYAQVMC